MQDAAETIRIHRDKHFFVKFYYMIMEHNRPDCSGIIDLGVSGCTDIENAIVIAEPIIERPIVCVRDARLVEEETSCNILPMPQDPLQPSLPPSNTSYPVQNMACCEHIKSYWLLYLVGTFFVFAILSGTISNANIK